MYDLQGVEAFFAFLGTSAVMALVGLGSICLLAGWLTGAVLRWRRGYSGVQPPTALTVRYLASEGLIAVAPPLVALLVALLGRAVIDSLHGDPGLVSGAIPLFGAYAVIRIGVLLFAASLGNKSWLVNWETRLTVLIWLIFSAEHYGWLDQIIFVLDSVGVAAGKSRITLWSVMKILFTLTLFVLAAVWISRWMQRRLKKIENLAPSTRIGIAKFANAFLIGLSLFLGLNAAGVDLTALTVLTGAIGLGLGFGLQSIAANFVSGFVLLMDRSIKPGDVISFSGQTGTSTENFGWVQEMHGRYVVLRDRDGVEMLVPNQQLISNPVINWSYTDPRVRLKLPVRVSYRDDPELALRVLVLACESHKRVLRDPAPVSRLMHFGDSGIELELRFWISDPQEGVNNVRSDVNREIWRLFRQNGLTIPIAQHEIHVHSSPLPDA
ncbi:MAG: mechanosensitive ion channel family protein [Steroidobacterales bacterium]